jgi:thiamine transporter
MKTTLKTQRLTVSAVMLAFATVLAIVCEFIPFLNLPFGGGFTVASMLPIVIISYMYGLKWGFFTSFAYSVIQVLVSLIMGKTVLALFTPASDDYMGIGIAFAIIFIDYLLAYTVLGIGGIFRNCIKNKVVAIVLGVVVALSLRYVCHIVSGYIFYGAWAEWFFSQDGFYAIGGKILGTFSGKGLALVYSIFYNGLYMIPEIIITAITASVVSPISHIKKMDA